MVDEAGQVAQATAQAAFYTAQDALVRAQRRKQRVERQYAAACAALVDAVAAYCSARQLLPGGDNRPGVD